MLLPSPVLIFLLPSLALAHGTHHVEQEPFSSERLAELERKWGTDVNIKIKLNGLSHTNLSEVGILGDLDIRTLVCSPRVQSRFVPVSKTKRNNPIYASLYIPKKY